MNPAKVFSGIALIFLGLMLYSLSLIPADSVDFAGIIMIGPFPIVVGNSAGLMVAVLLIAAMLVILTLSARW
ncbi:TIGR00304 family membrane protein [Geoglobus sp.]